MKARNLPAMTARKPRLELESLARSYTKTAIRTLAGIMNEEGMAPLARLAAAGGSCSTPGRSLQPSCAKAPRRSCAECRTAPP